MHLELFIDLQVWLQKICFELESKKEREDFTLEVTSENGEKIGEKNLNYGPQKRTLRVRSRTSGR